MVGLLGSKLVVVAVVQLNGSINELLECLDSLATDCELIGDSEGRPLRKWNAKAASFQLMRD